MAKEKHSKEYYQDIKDKFAEQRNLRLYFRPEGTKQFNSDLKGDLARYESDPGKAQAERDPINDTVDTLFIGGGFSALLTSARLREKGVESIRIVERGADVGGTWYWNQYPGVACDVVSYDYLPLLDELDYVPKKHYAEGPEIYAHCQAIAKKYDLYKLAVFQTTVTSTEWNQDEQLWHIKTDRGDYMRAKFVICANGPMCKPKLSKIKGIESYKGYSFHTSRWPYDYTKKDLSGLKDKVVGIIGTGASAVQIIPEVAKSAKALYVFQRTPSSIDYRDDWPTDPNWARKLGTGWQGKRRERFLQSSVKSDAQLKKEATMTKEEKLFKQETGNIDHMMRIHKHIDKVVSDPVTAQALKPWYMFMCKRPCFHNDYLPSFNRSNVHLVDTAGEGITEIKPGGPVFEGKTYDVDVLIYATGFEVQKTGIYNTIRGQEGLELTEKYKEGIRTLLGIHTHGFPNMFIMAGYQASFQFNLTDILNAQGEHISECIAYARDNNLNTLDTTHESEEWWVQEVISHRGKTTYNEDCTPGYYNFEGEFNRRQDGNYNGGFGQYIEHMGEVRKKMTENFILD